MKIIGNILFGLFAIFLIFILIYTVAYRDVKIDDSDLVYNPQKISDSENAYFVLLPALKQIREENINDEVIPLIKDEQVVDYEQARQLIHKHSSFLQVFTEAVEKDLYQLPFKGDVSDFNIDTYLLELRTLSAIEFLAIKELLREGEFTEASYEILKLLKLSYLLQNSGPLISSMIGAAIKTGHVHPLIRALANESNFDSLYYKQLMAQIEEYADNANGLADSFKAEYSICANYLLKGYFPDNPKGEDLEKANKWFKAYRQHPKLFKYLYNEHATRKELAKFYRQELENLRKPYPDILPYNEIKLLPGGLKRYVFFLSPNAIGRIFLAILTPNLHRVIEYKSRIDAEYNLIKLLLALKAYYVDVNDLPDNLDGLAPAHIAEIPKDPFDKEALKYLKADKIIYSIGPDMEDNRGDKEKDSVVKLNFSKDDL